MANLFVLWDDSRLHTLGLRRPLERCKCPAALVHMLSGQTLSYLHRVWCTLLVLELCEYEEWNVYHVLSKHVHLGSVSIPLLMNCQCSLLWCFDLLPLWVPPNLFWLCRLRTSSCALAMALSTTSRARLFADLLPWCVAPFVSRRTSMLFRQERSR